eukprot:888504-Prymnesium_polylepis.1
MYLHHAAAAFLVRDEVEAPPVTRKHPPEGQRCKCADRLRLQFQIVPVSAEAVEAAQTTAEGEVVTGEQHAFGATAHLGRDEEAE